MRRSADGQAPAAAPPPAPLHVGSSAGIGRTGSVGGGRTGRAMSPWRVARDADGTPYYYNKVTKVVQASGDAVGNVSSRARWTLSEAVDASLLSASQLACARHGGFVAGADRFANTAFRVSPAEEKRMPRGSE